jgi:hypothetical protein
MVRRPFRADHHRLGAAATSAGTLSAAGEALQRLPATVQRLWI